MKLLKTEKINTTNGWGFGGVIGTIKTYDNGVTLKEGRAYYRHSIPTNVKQYKVEVEKNFSIDIDGGINSTTKEIRVFKSSSNYYATTKDITKFSRYGMEYSLYKTILI